MQYFWNYTRRMNPWTGTDAWISLRVIELGRGKSTYYSIIGIG